MSWKYYFSIFIKTDRSILCKFPQSKPCCFAENLFSTQFDSQLSGEPKFVQLVHSLLEISYTAFLHPWTYFFSNQLLRYIVNFSLIKNAFTLILYFKKSTLKVSACIENDHNQKCQSMLDVISVNNYVHYLKYFIHHLQIVRDRYEVIIKNQSHQQMEDQPTKQETSKSNLSLLDSMISDRLVKSKLTRLNEIDRQINTFVIAGKQHFNV